MTKRWLIADQHFDHKNIIDLEYRPFPNMEEMEKGLIAAWNNVVHINHTVYILGDFSFKGVESWERLLTQLNGNKILIQGNHDRTNVVEKMVDKGLLQESYPVGKYEKIGSDRIYFSHYPIEIGERRNLFNIHGHTHGDVPQFINQINVGVDSIFMHRYYHDKSIPFGTPVPWEYVLEQMEEIRVEIHLRLKQERSSLFTRPPHISEHIESMKQAALGSFGVPKDIMLGKGIENYDLVGTAFDMAVAPIVKKAEEDVKQFMNQKEK